jgi:integrase
VEPLVERSAARGLIEKDISVHSFRHTFAARYLAANPGDLVTLGAFPKHSTFEATKMRYRSNFRIWLIGWKHCQPMPTPNKKATV